jgi:hypothetical protein
MLPLNLPKEADSSGQEAGSAEGLYLDDLARGAVVEIVTQHHHYRLVNRGDRHVRISGHPTFCPEPVEVEIEGSFRTGPPLKSDPGFIGRGMHLTFKHPIFDVVTTSRILEVHRLG